MRIAVIDLGTNTFKYILCELQDGKLVRLASDLQFVRLGKGGISDGRILQEAVDRAIHTLSDFKKQINRVGADEIVAIGTNVFRAAKNAEEVIEEIYEELRIKVHVISGEEEARLISFGVQHEINFEGEKGLIMDIGGGSTEFIICDEKKIYWKESFEIGAQRLMDAFYKEDPISLESQKEMYDFFDEELASLNEQISIFQPKKLIGSAGTFDTIRSMYEARTRETLTEEKNFVGTGIFNAMYQELLTLPRVQRLQIAGLISERVDMIVPAAISLQYVIEQVQTDRIYISESSLREGIFWQKHS
ncbi:Ppx/GppA phosphatase family protein [Sediminitomix flava]|uniref:Exopolyphosphatase/guanosine-5'-triphosphate, 3'-diphosphate pyrophosphatase n=1 Tax=Sediminitomix flava TaxID=379075 RepID=A0A315Z7C3_SEDFL|nr:phosphatase [Sediminitomix flava]PWJ39315.1 exopolyphosphatase/guanosine-5'-triphosphate,3'-diphosphate pyrophosphatase [Sediminitomix flava]